MCIKFGHIILWYPVVPEAFHLIDLKIILEEYLKDIFCPIEPNFMENVLLCVCWLVKRKIEVLIAQLTFIMLITSHPHKRRQNIWQTFALCKLNSFPKLRFRRPRRLLYYFVLKIWPEVWWSLMKKGTDWQGKNLNINEKRFVDTLP